MSILKTVTELAADRLAIVSAFESDDTSNDAKNMRMLSVVERKIAGSSFKTDADKLAGLGMLLDMGDAPNTFDNFKTALFSRMQECA